MIAKNIAALQDAGNGSFFVMSITCKLKSSSRDRREFRLESTAWKQTKTAPEASRRASSSHLDGEKCGRCDTNFCSYERQLYLFLSAKEECGGAGR